MSRSITGSSFLPPIQTVVSYKECLKNHAAGIGGHALDGCGEFMPSPTATYDDPTSLRCAACGCHRNFHRRDPYEPNAAATQFFPLPPTAAAGDGIHRSPSPISDPSRDTNTNSSQHHQPVTSPTPCSYYSSAPHMLLALSTGFSAQSDDHHHHHHPQPHFNQVVVTKSSSVNGRKRSRTKFSLEQKEKMLSFAERLGWKMNRAEEKLTQEFCSEVGVSRRVFKVWMHNNKNAFARKDQKGTSNRNNESVNDSSRASFDINGFTSNGKNHNEGNGNVHLVLSPKSEE